MTTDLIRRLYKALEVIQDNVAWIKREVPPPHPIAFHSLENVVAWLPDVVREIEAEVKRLKREVQEQIDTHLPVIWTQDADGIWRCSSCPITWTCETGTPRMNKIRFCPGCGGRIAKTEVMRRDD